MPLFSIILPTYNRANSISKAINSVINQRYDDWELIIIDDGSTDNTKQVVNNFLPDTRIKYTFQNNSERSVARNNGISKATGKYTCFLDSDDVFLENHLISLFNQIHSSNYPIAVLHTFGKIVSKTKIGQQELISHTSEHPINYILKHGVYLPCVCINSQILKSFNFNANITCAEDTDLLCRILSKYPLISVKEITFEYHIDDNAHLLSSEKHKKYIASFGIIFNDVEVSKYAEKKIIRNLYFKRYLWLLQSFLSENNRYGFLKYYFKTIKYNFWFLFSVECYTMFLKMIISKSNK